MEVPTIKEIEKTAVEMLVFVKKHKNGVSDKELKEKYSDGNQYILGLANALLLKHGLISEHPYSAKHTLATRKGRLFISFKIERLKKWYRDIPHTNWLLSEVLKYLVIAIVGGVIGGLSALRLLQKPHQKVPQEASQVTYDTTEVKKK